MARKCRALAACACRNTLTTTPPESLDIAHPAPMPPLDRHELPDSQESYVSAVSSTFSVPQLPPSSSNLSISTAGEADYTPAPPASKPFAPKQSPHRVIPASPQRARARDASLQIDAANPQRTGDTAASPMSVESPVAQGFKRSADGAVKGSTMTVNTSIKPGMGHKRPKSMDFGSSSRIGEVRTETYDPDNFHLWLIIAVAFCTTQNTSFLRHGQGAERLGKTVLGRVGRAHVPARIAHVRY